VSKFYRFFKFNNDNTEITLEGASINLGSSGVTIAAGGQTITAGGQTITAGGQTVTAGDVKVVGGDLFAGNKVYIGGTTTAKPFIEVVDAIPTTASPCGSLAIDKTGGTVYIQTGTATNTWKTFATPY
jgi:hypothetical protein